MRTARRIAALLLALALAAGLAACAASPSGTYTAVRVVKNGTEATAGALSDSGALISITFDSDGTGVLRFNAASEPFRWSGTTMTSQEGDTIDFRFDGTTVTLERGDTLIEFQ
ncbi:MAG: hypothetical protein IJG45_00110 [Oscillospiraceae bacterium]|nr:hypothetical protein [Oscillospiraceae bacterium]